MKLQWIDLKYVLQSAWKMGFLRLCYVAIVYKGDLVLFAQKGWAVINTIWTNIYKITLKII